MAAGHRNDERGYHLTAMCIVHFSREAVAAVVQIRHKFPQIHSIPPRSFLDPEFTKQQG
jgi:hypothetical protein